MVWAGRKIQVHREAGIYPAIIYVHGQSNKNCQQRWRETAPYLILKGNLCQKKF